jgi:hypothetical protein
MEKHEWFNIANFKSRDSIEIQTYVWFYDMEWLSHDRIIHYEYENYQSKSVVPFALTGGGDIWGWHIDLKEFMPIVLCLHDDNEGIFYAPSFEAALFRHILDFASQNNFCLGTGRSWEMELPMARKHLLNWKNKFRRWFAAEWLFEIDRLLNLNLKFYQVGSKPSAGDYYLLITPKECSELVQKYLDFELLDKTFLWTIDN